MELVGMDLIEDIVSAVLWTGHVDNAEKPVSLLVIAPPEHGKTQLVKGYRCNKGIIYISDVTTYGLVAKIQECQGRQERVNHIIIPDLLNPFSRAQAVVKSFTSFMNGLVEEGMTKIKTGAIEMNVEAKCGVIACLTPSQWNSNKKKWLNIGFLSRFIPVTYGYSRSMVMRVFDEASGAEPLTRSINLEFPTNKAKVQLDPKLHELLQSTSISIASRIGLEGIRLYRDLGILLKGVALRNGRDEVTNDDLETVVNFTDYMNYEFTLIK